MSKRQHCVNSPRNGRAVGTLTEAQRAALESGYQLMRACEALSAYLSEQLHPDRVLGALLNVVSHAGDRFDNEWNAAFAEHEAAEDSEGRLEAEPGEDEVIAAVHQ